ncbi:MAG: hypothetical protein JW759_00195, partial [Candidatus Coatesbacteria bacterium]|nr:hypothetical protein [Candidatus Coatesbacteria bacterium]
MNVATDRLIVMGGSEFQPLSSDTIALMAPYRVTRQMRGGDYVTTVVDQDAQIGGDMPTRFLLSESEELVASDGRHITLCPGALLGVMKTGRIVDGVMLSGKKVRDEYPSHWLNSQQWLRSRAEAMERGEMVFEGIRRLRVRCGSTAVNNNSPIFFQRQGFGGGAFFAKEPFVEAQLADDYLLLDDGIPVERYTAEFYKKRPFIGVRPERIRPGEVFDLTIVVCDPESFDNLLITRPDGLRTPEVHVKVNDLDITPALAEKFAGFNPFGFPSNATSPYPGFRLVWAQLKIDQEMPVRIAVEVRDALGNVNQTVKNYSIALWEDPLFGLHQFPLGLYGVPPATKKRDTDEIVLSLANVKAHGFNMVLPDNYTATCGTGSDNSATGYLHNKLPAWLQEAHNLGLVTAPGWLGVGDMACPACRQEDGPTGKGWQDRIERCFTRQYGTDPEIEEIKDLIDLVSLVDEPMPIDTLADDKKIPAWRKKQGCSLEEQAPFTFNFPMDIYWPEELTGPVNLEDYILGKRDVSEGAPSQAFFGPEQWRVRDMVLYFTFAFRQGKPVPLFINQLSQGDFDHVGVQTRNREIWAAFMQYCHYFSVDKYPDLEGAPLSEVARRLDQMHQAREEMWRGEGPFGGRWPYDQTRPYWWDCMAAWRLPKLWFVLHFGDWWGWATEEGSRGEAGAWVDEIGNPKGYGGVGRCAAPEEYKAMAYLAVIHGAKGLLFHRFPGNERDGWRPPLGGVHDELPEGVPYFDQSPNCNEQWGIAAWTNWELTYLAPIINSPDVDADVQIISEIAVPGAHIPPVLTDAISPVTVSSASGSTGPASTGAASPSSPVATTRQDLQPVREP